MFLATSIQDIDLRGHRNSNLKTRTNAAGEFALPAQMERYILLVQHDGGTARVEREAKQAAGDIRIQAWASLRGVLWQDGRPVAGQDILLGPLGWGVGWDKRNGPRIYNEYPLKTDDAGGFYVPRLPPGPLAASAYLGPWEKSPLTSSEDAVLDAKPGEKLTIDLGKNGATLTGRIDLTGEIPKGLDLTYSLNYLVSRTPAIAVPAPWNPLGLDLRKEWNAQRMESLEADAFRACHHRYFVKPEPDGRFRIVGVPPGDYLLSIRVFEKPEGCLVHPVGTKVVPVKVTASSGVVKLAPITLPVAPGLKLGEPLPKADLADAGGKPIDLAAFKGRYVLLHGWASWCVSCAKSYEPLRKFRSEWPTEKLAMVGLNLDADLAAMTTAAATQKFGWPQAHIGGESPEAERWQIGAIPLYLVIAPDGTLVHRGTSFAEAERFPRDKLRK